jgi:hypothetical protein
MFGAPYGMTPWRTANVTAVSEGRLASSSIRV